MSDQTIPPVMDDDDETHYCAVHPERETGLRCNKCDRYMCGACAVATPVGYRCKQCVRQTEDRYFTGTQSDYLVAFAVATALSAIGGAIVNWIGFILLVIFIAIPVGGLIAETTFRAINRRRGRNTAQVAAAGVVVGGLLGGAFHAWLSYPDEFREFRAQFEEAGMQVPPRFDDVAPALSTYVLENTLTISSILFIAFAAYAVYTRMKS